MKVPDAPAGRFDPAMFDPEGESLLINEVFYSLQGEGRNTGQATVFVRLAKCNLACKFCDTEFEAYRKQHFSDVVAKVQALVGEIHPHHVWIDLTGGEPGLQNCRNLIESLHELGFQVTMETNGTIWEQWMSLLDCITVSPKCSLDSIPWQLREEAMEFKWVVNATFLAQYERNPLSVFADGARNYLQPESTNPKWNAAAVKLILKHPDRYAMSIQTHKFLGIP